MSNVESVTAAENRFAVHPALSRDLARAPLLNAAQERDLAEQISEARVIAWQAALTAPRHLVCDLLPREPEKRTPEALAAADQAHDDVLLGRLADLARLPEHVGKRWAKNLLAGIALLTEASHALEVPNLRLVASMAARFMRRADARSFCIDDLIAWGTIGLRAGVRRFNPARGYRFSTYACWWIRHTITRAMQDNARTIRLPVHLQETIGRVGRARATLGDSADLAAVAEAAGVTPAQAAAADNARATVAHVVSLQSPVKHSGEASEHTIADLLADDSAPDPADMVDRVALLPRLAALVADLPSREREVITRRMGLGGVEEASLQDIGREIGISRERARQIQAEALGRMRRALRREGYTAAAMM